MTKFEKQCEKIAEGFKPMTQKQREYAKRHSPRFIMLYRNRQYCSECGKELHGTRCGTCGTNHKESRSFKMKKKHFRMQYYFRIESSAQETEYKRHFLIYKEAGMNKEPEYDMTEVTRNFLNEKGQRAVQSKSASTMSYYYDSWVMQSEMKTRPETGSIAYRNRNFHLQAYAVWPHGKPAQWLRKRGYTKPEPVEDNTFWQTKLVSEPFAEWLQKNRLTEILEEVSYERLKKFKRELELSLKHGYKIRDIIKWCNLVEENRELGRDTLNAKWSRPEDLDEAYEKTRKAIARKHEQERRAREKEEMEKNRERITQYEKGRLQWAGMTICGKNITIIPLTTAEELSEEGRAMHHCVASYWKYPESLILSARDKEGKRLATIEWNTETHETVQCRGVFNSTPEKQDLILKLMKRNRRKLTNAIQ